MKQIILLLLFLVSSVFANEIDERKIDLYFGNGVWNSELNASIGQEELIYAIKYRFVVVEELLQSIAIRPELLDIKEGESVALKATGHYDNGMERDITSQVLWSAAVPAVASVDANATLKGITEGATALTAKLDNITGTANVTVYKEINGYRLPPEPDPAVNNATLLGIDSNSNGVRDDVERWAINKYKNDHIILTKIALQGAKATQVIIQEPSRAKETREVFAKAYGCAGYFEFSADFYGEPLLLNHNIFGKEFKRVQFNTSQRARAFGLYNSTLSGGVYTQPTSAESRAGCDFNVTQLLKGD